MRFLKGADVFTATGEKIGSVSRIVIDAKTRDVTDLVVERGSLLSTEEKVIPVGLVDLENEDRITLRETNQNVDDFLDYETTHYVPVENAGAPYENMEANYWYPPVNFQLQVPRVGLISDAVPDQVAQTQPSIPEGRVAISEGAQVLSADDEHIGNVEQVIADSESNTVTHFVVGKGFLLKEHKLVPAFWVTTMDGDKLRLSVEARQFEKLPDYNPD
ncbi:MAG TPA: PRC-barrel domain-containing protein [Anaerolineales bacterium]|nr:PRC-barrel domain-containing protein [Anaerolineales bacterium]